MVGVTSLTWRLASAWPEAAAACCGPAAAARHDALHAGAQPAGGGGRVLACLVSLPTLLWLAVAHRIKLAAHLVAVAATAAAACMAPRPRQSRAVIAVGWSLAWACLNLLGLACTPGATASDAAWACPSALLAAFLVQVRARSWDCSAHSADACAICGPAGRGVVPAPAALRSAACTQLH